MKASFGPMGPLATAGAAWGGSTSPGAMVTLARSPACFLVLNLVMVILYPDEEEGPRDNDGRLDLYRSVKEVA